MLKKVLAIFAAVATLATLAGGAIAIDRHYNKRFATVETVDLVATRLDRKIIRDNLKDLYGQLRDIKIKFGEDVSKYPDYIRELYYKIIDAIKLEEKELNGDHG